ncbi:MAG: TROVE domain-containing protein [Thiobacillaceae bacterium]
MRTNIKFQTTEKTHEGAPSTAVLSAAAQLRRTVMSCMLFEGSFYESGEDSAKRMQELIKSVPFADAAQIAIDAREKMKLRHAPLFLLREMLRVHKGRPMGDLIARVIQRPDELGELLALYWKDGKNQPLTAQLKIGLARALKKFNAYQLSKWNKDGDVKLRDVMFLSHARPTGEEQEALFKQIADDTLPIPETWEVLLSGGADKKATFERLMADHKLGALALLRNLRGMIEAQVSEDRIREALASMKADRVLPFRFIAAARYAPRLEDALEQAMFRCLAEMPKLEGKTALLIDHSGSMQAKVSAKSEISRFDAAAALAMILRATAERCRVFTFSNRMIEVPPRRGFALVQAVREVINPTSTLLGSAVREVYKVFPECDRIIVVTDEQSADRPPHPQGHGYIVNVGGYQNGIGYGPWVTVDGWSEAILDYIKAYESES